MPDELPVRVRITFGTGPEPGLVQYVIEPEMEIGSGVGVGVGLAVGAALGVGLGAGDGLGVAVGAGVGVGWVDRIRQTWPPLPSAR